VLQPQIASAHSPRTCRAHAFWFISPIVCVVVVVKKGVCCIYVCVYMRGGGVRVDDQLVVDWW
jgi:hypothetical protein